jgi:hypothetical protein
MEYSQPRRAREGFKDALEFGGLFFSEQKPLFDVVATQTEGKQIHVIADNLSAHKSVASSGTLAVQGALGTRPYRRNPRQQSNQRPLREPVLLSLASLDASCRGWRFPHGGTGRTCAISGTERCDRGS